MRLQRGSLLPSDISKLNSILSLCILQVESMHQLLTSRETLDVRKTNVLAAQVDEVRSL